MRQKIKFPFPPDNLKCIFSPFTELQDQKSLKGHQEEKRKKCDTPFFDNGNQGKQENLCKGKQ